MSSGNISNGECCAQVYDADLQNGLVFGHVHKERSALEEGAMLLAPLKLDARRPDFEQVLSLIAFDNQALTKILGDLLQYGDETLDNRALKMMLRVYEQRHELVETMQRTELLVNHAVINSYFEHMAIMKDLEDLVLTLGLIVDEVLLMPRYVFLRSSAAVTQHPASTCASTLTCYRMMAGNKSARRRAARKAAPGTAVHTER